MRLFGFYGRGDKPANRHRQQIYAEVRLAVTELCELPCRPQCTRTNIEVFSQTAERIQKTKERHKPCSTSKTCRASPPLSYRSDIRRSGRRRDLPATARTRWNPYRKGSLRQFDCSSIGFSTRAICIRCSHGSSRLAA